jgi:ABC-type dipeptide/oligopeptide/nickel transport system permease component
MLTTSSLVRSARGDVPLSAVFVVLANLVVDLFYPLLDPRIVLR